MISESWNSERERDAPPAPGAKILQNHIALVNQETKGQNYHLANGVVSRFALESFFQQALDSCINSMVCIT
jgi:hypothetical protein